MMDAMRMAYVPSQERLKAIKGECEVYKKLLLLGDIDYLICIKSDAGTFLSELVDIKVIHSWPFEVHDI